MLKNVRADDEMFARRGGWKYLKQDLKFQKFLYRSRYIGVVDFGFNCIIRTIMRIMPNWLRVCVYKNKLRK